MPSASEYNTYVSPVSRATALAQSRAQLAQTKEATAGARQNREFQAQREPMVQHDITLSNIGQEQKIAMMDDALRNTGLASEIMQVAPLTGEQRRAAISNLAKSSKTPSFWQRALSVPENNQNDMFGGLIQYSQQKGYLKAPDKPNPTNWQIKEGVGPNGQPTYFAVNPETLETKPLDQFAPPPKSGETITTNPEGGVTITRGVGVGQSSGLSRPTAAKIEQKLVSLAEMDGRLARVKDYFDPEILTYGRQIRNKVSTVKDKLGLAPDREDQSALEQSTRFNTELDQLFNAYRKEITGAAASVQELDRLKASMINSDMGPTEFQAAFEQFTRQIEEDTALYRNLLQQGVSPETAGKAIDDSHKEKSAAKQEADREAEIMAKYGL